MDTMETAVLIVHTFIAVMLIVLVLLQRGKGADAGAAFGSGASGTVFGARGSSNFFSRATAILATCFFATSLGLAYMSSQHSDAPDSLLEDAPVVSPEDAQDAAPDDAENTPAGADEPAEMPALPETDDTPAANDGSAELPPLEPAPTPEDDEQQQP